MELIAVLIIAAAVFGVCFLIDKGFTKLFRSQAQHYSGTAVRLNKRYASVGLIVAVFGVVVLFAGLSGNWLLFACGIILILFGAALVTYYMTFGIFYDENGFVVTTFGKKSTSYTYKDIQGQQLYVTTGGQTVVEIYLLDGRTFQLQSTMKGAYEFLDKAYLLWLKQTGKNPEECQFHDPDKCCWFPAVGE